MNIIIPEINHHYTVNSRFYCAVYLLFSFAIREFAYALKYI